MKRIEKGIYERGPYQYLARVMVGGEQLNSTFETLEEARAFLNLKRAAIALDPDAGHIAATRVKRSDANAWTVGRLLDRYAVEVTPTKRGAKQELLKIARFKRLRISKISIYRVTRDDILDVFKDIRATAPPYRPVSDSTLRKYASVLSNMFTIAAKRWGLAVKNPVSEVELPKPGPARQRRLDDELERRYFFASLAKCRRKQILPFARLAFITAMRRGELFAMHWDQVRIDPTITFGSVRIPLTKNGEARVVPLTTEACEIISAIPRVAKDPRVFQLSGTQIRSAWDSAIERAQKAYQRDCQAAGQDPDPDFLKGLRLHDLRHEATSGLFEVGLDVMEASSITGHKTLQMLKDYTHLRAEKLAKKINAARLAEAEAETGKAIT